jgi:hypothetical protein
VRAKGYAEIFPELLTQASLTVTQGLKKHLPERQR